MHTIPCVMKCIVNFNCHYIYENSQDFDNPAFGLNTYLLMRW